MLYDTAGFEKNEIIEYQKEEFLLCNRGCYTAGTMITRETLQYLLHSFKYFAVPHQFTDGRCVSPWYGETGANELLCPELTGLYKVVPVRDIYDYSIHHMSNKYVNSKRYFHADELSKILLKMKRAKIAGEMLLIPKFPNSHQKIPYNLDNLKHCSIKDSERYALQVRVPEKVHAHFRTLHLRKRFRRAFCDFKGGVVILYLHENNANAVLHLDLYSGLYFSPWRN